MISTLTGRVSALTLDSLVLEVGGVGLAVRTTPQAIADARHGQQTTMHTELIVREDSLTLYGFPSPEEADTFRVIQSVSGIGPRIALAVLAVMTPDDLRAAVAAGDAKAITRTPGIGPKVAQRMLLELKDRIGAPNPSTNAAAAADAPAPAAAGGPIDDVVRALVGLGWPEKAATDAAASAADDAGDDPAALLRAALRSLGGTR